MMGLDLRLFAFAVAVTVTAASASSPPAVGGRQVSPEPLQTPAPIHDRSAPARIESRQRQVPFQLCPEQAGKPKQSCPSCGGDTKVAGYCDNILLNGPQDHCSQEGCGIHCACDPVPNEHNGPPPDKQVPFQICPEAIGKPKKACSDCGGSNSGLCKNILLNGPQAGCLSPGCGFYCQCNDGDTGHSPTTQLVTSVVNGKTVTGTFTPTTISQYKDLRASTTVTTSENGHETALVILAGGVAWGLANWAELGAAGAALTAEGAPEGSEEDDQACSKPEKKCADCGGSNAIGLCSSGSEANCPCEDDKCPSGDDQPKCADCKGDDSHKCQDGPHKGCDCKPDEKCPDFVTCDNCGGGDSEGKCKGISDQNNKWKGCDCYEIIDDDDVTEYDPFNTAELLAQDAFLASLGKGGGDQQPSDPSRGHPSNDPKCADNQVPGYLLVNKVKTSNSVKTPKEILYMMRETLCNNKCENPPDLPQKSVFATPDQDGCEIAVAIESAVEAWVYRGTHSQGLQWQECWDSTMNITEKCVQDKLATGWVNGPDPYEFFQVGYRPINGKGSKHSPFANDAPLEHWCPDTKPSCDTCFGGGSGNVCSQGENQGCACEPVTYTQPPAPQVTNCATAIAAAEISCCNGGRDGYTACAQKIAGCGINSDLEAACQYAITAESTYQVCGQFSADGGIVRGSNQEDIATCLDRAFGLHGQWKYA